MKLKHLHTVAVSAFFVSVVTRPLFAQMFGDQTFLLLFSAWTAAFAVFFAISLKAGLRHLRAAQSQDARLVVPALAIVALATWIAIVAVSGITFGLYAYRVLNASGLAAWTVGTVVASIASLATGVTSDGWPNSPKA
jgi:hypothetical protein